MCTDTKCLCEYLCEVYIDFCMGFCYNKSNRKFLEYDLEGTEFRMKKIRRITTTLTALACSCVMLGTTGLVGSADTFYGDVDIAVLSI